MSFTNNYMRWTVLVEIRGIVYFLSTVNNLFVVFPYIQHYFFYLLSKDCPWDLLIIIANV